MRSHTALVIIDAQVAIIGSPDVYDGDAVLRRIASLLAAARAAGTPIFFVQHDHATFLPLMPGHPGWEIHPAIAPKPGELVIRKRASDAFYATSLRSELDRLGVTRLVVAGCQTEYCVDTSVRRALSLDYDVLLVADGHTTTDGDLLSAPHIIAHHNAMLAGLPHPTREIRVRPADEIAFVS